MSSTQLLIILLTEDTGAGREQRRLTHVGTSGCQCYCLLSFLESSTHITLRAEQKFQQTPAHPEAGLPSDYICSNAWTSGMAQSIPACPFSPGNRTLIHKVHKAL